MADWAKVGAKVVCVNVDTRYEHCDIHLGNVYQISEVGDAAYFALNPHLLETSSDEIAVRLVGFVFPIIFPHEYIIAFAISCFRPLTSTEQTIEALKSIKGGDKFTDTKGDNIKAPNRVGV